MAATVNRANYSGGPSKSLQRVEPQCAAILPSSGMPPAGRKQAAHAAKRALCEATMIFPIARVALIASAVTEVSMSKRSSCT